MYMRDTFCNVIKRTTFTSVDVMVLTKYIYIYIYIGLFEMTVGVSVF